MIEGGNRRLAGILLIALVIGAIIWVGITNFRSPAQPAVENSIEPEVANSDAPVSNEIVVTDNLTPEELAADKAEENAVVPAGIAMRAEDIVQSRQAAFYLSAMAMSRINAGVKLEDDIEYLQWPSAFLSQWAEALPLMFPEGSLTRDSKALETVWTDRAGFEKRAADFARLTAELSEIARSSKDKEEFKAKREQVIDACDACHDRYHVPD